MPVRMMLVAVAVVASVFAGSVAGNAVVTGMDGLGGGYALPAVGDESEALAQAEFDAEANSPAAVEPERISSDWAMMDAPRATPTVPRHTTDDPVLLATVPEDAMIDDCAAGADALADGCIAQVDPEQPDRS